MASLSGVSSSGTNGSTACAVTWEVAPRLLDGRNLFSRSRASTSFRCSSCIRRSMAAICSWSMLSTSINDNMKTGRNARKIESNLMTLGGIKALSSEVHVMDDKLDQIILALAHQGKMFRRPPTLQTALRTEWPTEPPTRFCPTTPASTSTRAKKLEDGAPVELIPLGLNGIPLSADFQVFVERSDSLRA